MGLSIGLGLHVGNSFVGADPPADVNTPAVLVSSASNIVVVGAEALAPADFLSAVPGTQVLSLGGIGITLTGTAGLGTWGDLSGNAHPWVNGGAEAVCGVYTTADATLSGLGSVLFNGTSQWIPNSNLNPAAPGTTPFWARIIAKQISRVATGQLIGASLTNRLAIRCGGASPNVNAGNGTTNTADVAMTLNQWFAVDLLFNNGTTDYLHIGATKNTGANLGNIDPSAVALGARSDGTVNWGNFAVGGIIIANAEPAGRLTTLNALCTKWWRGAVTLPS